MLVEAFPSAFTTSERLARTMLKVAHGEVPSFVLNRADIR